MSNLAAEYQALANYRPTHKVRFVTAASLFDGHDAAINIMRRILQGMGAEVIHLGHNRSVDEVVTAALQEDAQGIAISSYQGGHVEYFKYMVDLLKSRGGEHIQVFGGGGGVIVPSEIRELQDYGVTRIYSPEDGQKMGLAGMIGEMVMRCDRDLSPFAPTSLAAIEGQGEMNWRALAQLITVLENGNADAAIVERPARAGQARKKVPVLGITGTGGAGKSSLTDELIRRLRLDQDDSLRVAVISIDPSRRKSGGALLGDRIRMNAINPWQQGQRVYMRFAGHARLRQRDQRRPARRDRRLQVRRLRPHRGRDLGHRPGRRGHRAARGPAHVRDDARVRRGQPAGEDRHARLRRVCRHQQVRPQGLARRPARRVQAGAAQPGSLEHAARPDAGVRHHGRALQRRRRDRALPRPQGPPDRTRPAAERRPPAHRQGAPQHQPDAHRAARPARATWPRSATPCAATRRRRCDQARLAREIQQLTASARMLRVEKPERSRAAEAAIDLAAAARTRPGPRRAQAAGAMARHAEGLRRRRVRGEDPRQGNPHRAHHQEPLGHRHPQGGAAASTRTTARS